jgi:hypothetical protein
MNAGILCAVATDPETRSFALLTKLPHRNAGKAVLESSHPHLSRVCTYRSVILSVNRFPADASLKFQILDVSLACALLSLFSCRSSTLRNQ